MTEPCLCGANDCPSCFPWSLIIDTQMIDVPEPAEFEPDNDPTLGSCYDEPPGWP